jgi:hypothetical protein
MKTVRVHVKATNDRLSVKKEPHSAGAIVDATTEFYNETPSKLFSIKMSNL